MYLDTFSVVLTVDHSRCVTDAPAQQLERKLVEKLLWLLHLNSLHTLQITSSRGQAFYVSHGILLVLSLPLQ